METTAATAGLSKACGAGSGARFAGAWIFGLNETTGGASKSGAAATCGGGAGRCVKPGRDGGSTGRGGAGVACCVSEPDMDCEGVFASSTADVGARESVAIAGAVAAESVSVEATASGAVEIGAVSSFSEAACSAGAEIVVVACVACAEGDFGSSALSGVDAPLLEEYLDWVGDERGEALRVAESAVLRGAEPNADTSLAIQAGKSASESGAKPGVAASSVINFGVLPRPKAGSHAKSNDQPASHSSRRTRRTSFSGSSKGAAPVTDFAARPTRRVAISSRNERLFRINPAGFHKRASFCLPWARAASRSSSQSKDAPSTAGCRKRRAKRLFSPQAASRSVSSA